MRLFVRRMEQTFPKGWGVAWFRSPYREAVVLPIPLNIFAGIMHRAWLALEAGVPPGARDRALEFAFEEGRRHGSEEATMLLTAGFDRICKEHVDEAFSRGFNAGMDVGER